MNVAPDGNKLVDDLILTFDTEFRLLNDGDRASQSVVTDLNQEVLKSLTNLQGLISSMVMDGCTRNSACYCLAGKEDNYKYKHCCGKKLSKFLDGVVRANSSPTNRLSTPP